MTAAIPQMKDQFRAHVDWIERQLGDGRQWLLNGFSLADINAYMNVWYALGNLPGLEAMLRQFPHVLAWVARVKAVGHGERSEMSSQDALELAAAATPQSPVFADPNDPNGRKPGDRVSVTPDDYGKVAVVGEIVSLSGATHRNPPPRRTGRRHRRTFSTCRIYRHRRVMTADVIIELKMT